MNTAAPAPMATHRSAVCRVPPRCATATMPPIIAPHPNTVRNSFIPTSKGATVSLVVARSHLRVCVQLQYLQHPQHLGPRYVVLRHEPVDGRLEFRLQRIRPGPRLAYGWDVRWYALHCSHQYLRFSVYVPLRRPRIFVSASIAPSASYLRFSQRLDCGLSPFMWLSPTKPESSSLRAGTSGYTRRHRMPPIAPILPNVSYSPSRRLTRPMMKPNQPYGYRPHLRAGAASAYCPSGTAGTSGCATRLRGRGVYRPRSARAA
jgi:hypothetical protein